MNFHPYPLRLRPLSQQEGGGWLAEVPDLPGCQSDGDTPQEAAANVQDAITAMLATLRELGQPIPEPGSADLFHGRSLLEIDRPTQAEIIRKADLEGLHPRDYATHALKAGMRSWHFGQHAGKPYGSNHTGRRPVPDAAE